MVERKGRRHRAVLLCAHAVVHGHTKSPGLACIAPYDGNVDTYRCSAYTGGIPGAFPSIWFNSTVRQVNRYPATGPSRLVDWDYTRAVMEHNTYDDFWRERAAAENLDKIKVPVLSIGVWSKVDLHLNGNIVGFQRTTSDKKLLVFGSSSVFAAVADYSSVAFHEEYLRPFYDMYLKGEATSYAQAPTVRYFLNGADEFKSAATWPPAGRELPALVSFFRSKRFGQFAERRRALVGCLGIGKHRLRLSKSRLAGGGRRI